MPNPNISIILPTFNRDYVIADTIENILSQTFNNFELIIIDDASTDQTSDIIKSYQEKSEIPLLIASDYERGLGMFVDGTLFPSNMAVAATNDSSLAYEQGRITAFEAKSIGVNMILAPVLDINNNLIIQL